jgi:pimeloyl-ACP methyl ester carboxylesterase
MPFINVGEENSGSIDLYYEDHGTGKPVVLLHGWPLDGSSWEKQVSVLLSAGYRVITYDRRGFGKSSKPATGYEYDTLSKDLSKVIKKLDLRDTVLIGFSMGNGEVARYLGTYGSERVSKAIFISPILPCLKKTADNPDGVDVSVFNDIKSKIVADRPAYLTEFLMNFYNYEILRGERVSEEVFRLSWNIASGASPTGTLECVNAWLTDFRNDLSHINIPSLIIHGDADRILPLPSTSQRLPGFLKMTRLVVVEGGPHGIIWTHSEKVNKELIGFIA